MLKEEIIVLASSRKLGGRCVAGISTATGKWVRPVSDPHDGLDFSECAVEGRWPEPLDIVSFGRKGHLDDPAQPENVLIDDQDWRLVGALARKDAYARLSPRLATGPMLFGNKGKAVADEETREGVDSSLALIEPDLPVELLLRPSEETHGKLKPRVVFRLSGSTYELNLTDFDVSKAVLRAGCGRHTPEMLGLDDSGNTLLCVSLGGAHNGWHTKLAAAVLFLP